MENSENKKHIEEVYLDKALNSLKICIGILIFSSITYLIGFFVFHSFDFGLIFEIISFIFIIFSYNKIEKKDFNAGKRNCIIAMIPIGWLIIYDFINLVANIGEVLGEIINYFTSFDQYFYYLTPYLLDVTLVVNIVLLYRTYASLNRADGTTKSENYVDTFYDNL